MKTNSNFGKLVNPCIVDGVKRSDEIVLAPHQIVTATLAIPCPTAEVYAHYGFLPINRTTKRVASAGHELVRVGWEERGGAIYGVWEERELPPTVHTFTPLALMRVLTIVGQWDTVRTALKAAGEEVYEQFIAAIELKEDDPAFAPFLAWARAQFGEQMLNRLMDAAAQGTEYVNTLTAADLTGGAE